MGNQDVQVLGRFIPTEYQQDAIEREFKDLLFLPPCCKLERVSVRVPHELAPDPHPDNLQWHQDGGGLDGTTRHMIVWASEQPTDIRDRHGVTRELQALDVIWFNNDYAYHKQPTGTDEKRRWFVSVRCSGAL